MAMRPLPETTIDVETGETLRRDVRPFEVTYKGLSKVADLPGYYPLEGGKADSLHIGADMFATDEVFRELKQQVDGLSSADNVRETPAKLKFSQR